MARLREWLRTWLTTKHMAVGAVILLALSFYLGGRLQERPEAALVVRSEEAPDKSKGAAEGQKTAGAAAKGPAEVVVHVAGAVQKPGVYAFPQGTRLQAAVQKAVPLAEAAPDALNLAALLTDGEKIVVPQKGEAAPAEAGASAPAPGSAPAGGKVSINKADKTQLETLPGIGPAKAEAIIAYRKENGGFKDIHELKEVSGIGEKTFSQLADQIAL